MRIRTGMRRTTTQMLNNSRRRTGLSASRRSSLLSSVRNQDSRLTNSRLMNTASIQSARLTAGGESGRRRERYHENRG